MSRAAVVSSAALPSTVAFDYQPEGVRVAGRSYPILKMAWAEGEGLAEFTARHLEDLETLRALAEAWRALLADLAAAGVAHGDLQHGNVLVRTDGGAIRLELASHRAVGADERHDDRVGDQAPSARSP